MAHPSTEQKEHEVKEEKLSPKFSQEIQACFDFWDKPLDSYFKAVAEGKPQAGMNLNIRLWRLLPQDQTYIQEKLDELEADYDIRQLQNEIESKASEEKAPVRKISPSVNLANKLYLLSLLHYLKNGQSAQAVKFAQQARDRNCPYVYVQMQMHHLNADVYTHFETPFLNPEQIAAASVDPDNYSLDSEILYLKGYASPVNSAQALRFYCLATFSWNWHSLAYFRIADILNDPNNSDLREEYLANWQEWYSFEVNEIYQRLINKAAVENKEEKNTPSFKAGQIPQHLEQVNWELLSQAYRLASVSRGNFFQIYNTRTRLETPSLSQSESQKIRGQILERAAYLGDYRCTEELFHQLDSESALKIAQLGAEKGSQKLLFQLVDIYIQQEKLFEAFLWLQKAQKKENTLERLAELMMSAYNRYTYSKNPEAKAKAFNVFTLCAREIRQIIAHHLSAEFSLNQLSHSLNHYYDSYYTQHPDPFFFYHFHLLFKSVSHFGDLPWRGHNQFNNLARQAIAAKYEQRLISDDRQDFFGLCAEDKLSDIQAALHPALVEKFFRAYALKKAVQKALLIKQVKSPDVLQKILYYAGQSQSDSNWGFQAQKAVIKALTLIYKRLHHQAREANHGLPPLEGLEAEDALTIIHFFAAQGGGYAKAWELAQRFPHFTQNSQQNHELSEAINEYNTRISIILSLRPIYQALEPEEKYPDIWWENQEAQKAASRIHRNLDSNPKLAKAWALAQRFPRLQAEEKQNPELLAEIEAYNKNYMLTQAAHYIYQELLSFNDAQLPHLKLQQKIQELAQRYPHCWKTKQINKELHEEIRQFKNQQQIKALTLIYQTLLPGEKDAHQHTVAQLDQLPVEQALSFIQKQARPSYSKMRLAWNLAQRYWSHEYLLLTDQQKLEFRPQAVKDQENFAESKYSAEDNQGAPSELQDGINTYNTLPAKIRALISIYQTLLPQKNDVHLQKLRELQGQTPQALAYVLNQLSAKNPNSKLSKAWTLAERYYQYATNEHQYTNLFREIYLYNFNHSGIFCRSQISGKTFFSFNRHSLAQYLFQHREVFSKANVQAQLQTPRKYDRTRKIYEALEGRPAPIAPLKKVPHFFALFKPKAATPKVKIASLPVRQQRSAVL